MPNYRRYRVHGGTYFFTLKTERNAPLFAELQNVRLLGAVFRETIARWPFEMTAVVLLPDHLHALWTLPPGDADYSTRWARLKKEFTRRFLAAGGHEQTTSASRRRNGRRGVWQRRFWEHTIEDDADFDRHFDDLHWNPVKHGFAKAPVEWPLSSFHRWVKQGVYPANWGGDGQEPTGCGNVIEAGE